MVCARNDAVAFAATEEGITRKGLHRVAPTCAEKGITCANAIIDARADGRIVGVGLNGVVIPARNYTVKSARLNGIVVACADERVAGIVLNQLEAAAADECIVA